MCKCIYDAIVGPTTTAPTLSTSTVHPSLQPFECHFNAEPAVRTSNGKLTSMEVS